MRTHNGQVGGGIENGDEEEKRGGEGENHLNGHRLRDVLTGAFDFFGHVRHAVRRSHGEGAIDHAG